MFWMALQAGSAAHPPLNFGSETQSCPAANQDILISNPTPTDLENTSQGSQQTAVPASASIIDVCVCHVLHFPIILWAELHSPKHRRPLSDSTKPGGQTHWKLPGVLVHVPKRQMLGSSSHSLISGSIADVLFTEQPKVTPFFMALKPGEVVISGELCCLQVTTFIGYRDSSPNPERTFRANGTMKWSGYNKNTDPLLSWEQRGRALCPVISRQYLGVMTYA